MSEKLVTSRESDSTTLKELQDTIGEIQYE